MSGNPSAAVTPAGRRGRTKPLPAQQEIFEFLCKQDGGMQGGSVCINSAVVDKLGLWREQVGVKKQRGSESLVVIRRKGAHSRLAQRPDTTTHLC